MAAQGDGLQARVVESGENWSVGQRQLLGGAPRARPGRPRGAAPSTPLPGPAPCWGPSSIQAAGREPLSQAGVCVFAEATERTCADGA